MFQSPRGDFGFLKEEDNDGIEISFPNVAFQSPRGDFGFLKANHRVAVCVPNIQFQSPRGDFGFLKLLALS